MLGETSHSCHLMWHSSLCLSQHPRAKEGLSCRDSKNMDGDLLWVRVFVVSVSHTGSDHRGWSLTFTQGLSVDCSILGINLQAPGCAAEALSGYISGRRAAGGSRSRGEGIAECCVFPRTHVENVKPPPRSCSQCERKIWPGGNTL